MAAIHPSSRPAPVEIASSSASESGVCCLCERIRQVVTDIFDYIASLFERLKQWIWTESSLENLASIEGDSLVGDVPDGLVGRVATIPRRDSGVVPRVVARAFSASEASTALDDSGEEEPASPAAPALAPPSNPFQWMSDLMEQGAPISIENFLGFCRQYTEVQAVGMMSDKQFALMMLSRVKRCFLDQTEQGDFERRFRAYLGVERDVVNSNLFDKLLNREQGIYRDEVISSYLREAQVLYVREEDGFHLMKVASATLKTLKLPHTEQSEKVVIRNDELQKLYLFVRHEERMKRELQETFNQRYCNEDGWLWGVEIQRVGFAQYRIVVADPRIQISAKVLYSLHRLFIEAEKALPQAERQWSERLFDEIFTDDTILANKGFSPISWGLFERIHTLLTTTSDKLEKHERLLQICVPDEKFSFVPSSKTLSDLFQQSPKFVRSADPAEDAKREREFQIEFKISRWFAEILQGQAVEKGSRVSLPTGLQLRTFSDRVMRFEESVYGPSILGLEAWNGKKKNFIDRTRERGKEHQSNCDERQLEQVNAVLEGIAYAIQKKDSSWRPEIRPEAEVGALCDNYRDLVTSYARQAATELKQWFQTPLLRSYCTQEVSEALTRLEGAGRTASLSAVEKAKHACLQAFLTTGATCGPSVWKAEVVTVRPEELAAKFYSAPLPQGNGSRIARAAMMEHKFTVVTEHFKAMPIYQGYLTNPSFVASMRNLEAKFRGAIEDARGFAEDSFYGIQYLEQAFSYWEKTIYFLSKFEEEQELSLEQKVRFTKAAERMLQDFNLEAGPQGWQGCTEGLYTRMEKLFHSMMGADGLDPTLSYKTELATDFWLQYVLPSVGYEEAIVKSDFDKLLSRAIGLGMAPPRAGPYQVAETGATRAAAFIKTHLYPYDLFAGYYDLYRGQLYEAKKAQRAPDFLHTKLGLDLRIFGALVDDEDQLPPASLDPARHYCKEGAWDYYRLEQELPRLIIEFLIRQDFLMPGPARRPVAYEVSAEWSAAERTGIYRSRDEKVPSKEEIEAALDRETKEALRAKRNLAVNAPWARCLPC